MATPGAAPSDITSDEEEDELTSDDQGTEQTSPSTGTGREEVSARGQSEAESDEDEGSEASGDEASEANATIVPPQQTTSTAKTVESSMDEEENESSDSPSMVPIEVPTHADTTQDEEESASAVEDTMLRSTLTLEEEGDLEDTLREKTNHLVEITLAMPWGSETIAAYTALWNEDRSVDACIFHQLFFNPYDPLGVEPFDQDAADKVAVVERGEISLAMKGNNAAHAHCVGVLVVDNHNIGDDMPFETKEILRGECAMPVFLIGAEDGEKVISCLLSGQVVVENVHDRGPVGYYGEHPSVKEEGRQTKVVWNLEFSTRAQQKIVAKCQPSSWTSMENLLQVRGRCFFEFHDKSAKELADKRRFGMVRFGFRGSSTFQDKLEKSQVCAALVVINSDNDLPELKIDSMDPRMIPAFLISREDGNQLIQRFDRIGEGLSLNYVTRVIEKEARGSPDDQDVISIVEEAVVQAATLQVLIGPYELRFPCLTTDWTTYTDLVTCEGTIIVDNENPFGTLRKHYPEDTILVVRRGEVSYHEKAINAQEGGCRCLLICAENMPTFFVISSLEGATKAAIPTVLIRDSVRCLLQHAIQRGERARVVGWICGHQQGGEGITLQFKDDVDQTESDPKVYAITCSGDSAADWEMLHAYKLSSEMAEDKILCVSEAEFIGDLPDAIRSGVVAMIVMQPSEPYMLEVPAHQCDILIASCNEIEIFNMLDNEETVTKVGPCAPESDLWLQLVFNAPPWHVNAVLGDWVMDMRTLRLDVPVVFLKKNPTGENSPFARAEVEGAFVLVEESTRAFFRLAVELKHAGALGFIMAFKGRRIPLMVSHDANVPLPGLAISNADMRTLRAGRGSSDTIVRGPLGVLHLVAYDVKDMVYLPEPVTRDLKDEKFEVWLTCAAERLNHFHVKGIMSIMTTFTQCTHDLINGILSPVHAQGRISLQHAVPFGNRTVLQNAQLQGIRGLLAINMKNATPHCLGHHDSATFPTVSISHEDGMHILDLLGNDIEIRIVDVAQTKQDSGASGGTDMRSTYEARIDAEVEANKVSHWETLHQKRRAILREMMRVPNREDKDTNGRALPTISDVCNINAKQCSDDAFALVDTFTATPGCEECSIISAQLHAIIQSLLGCSRIVVEGQWNSVELCGALKTYLLPLVDLDSRIPALLRRCEADFENFPVGKDTVFLQFDQKALKSLTHDYFTQESAPLRFSTRAAPTIVSGKGKVMVCAEIVYDCPPFDGGPSIGMQLLLPAPVMDVYIEGSLLDSQGADRSAICKTSAFGVQAIMTLEPGAAWEKCHLCDHRNDAFVEWLRDGSSNLLLVVEWYRG